MSSPEHADSEQYLEFFEESTENVVELLRRYDQELLRAEKVPPEASEDYLLRGHTTEHIEQIELAEEARDEAGEMELEDFTQVLRSTLNLVGLSDPSSVVPENIKAIDSELLEQLDPYNAESLFFDVAKKVHTRLGQYAPVTWRRMMEQAKPENRALVNLDALQLNQRFDAISFLLSLNVDPKQLSDMSKSSAEVGVASPSTRQNLNRAAYFFEEEPILSGLVKGLRRRKATGAGKLKPKIVNYRKTERFEEPVPLERIVKMAQVILRFKIEVLQRRKDKQENLRFDNENVWDSIDYDVYKKMTRRLKSSLAISNLILAEMVIKNIDDLTDGITDIDLGNGE